MLKVSESYILGVDISENDELAITISKFTGTRLEQIRTFTGKEAEDIYNKAIATPYNKAINYENTNEEVETCEKTV